MNKKERKTTSVGSFKEAAPIVDWGNSVFEIKPEWINGGVTLTVGLYDKNDDRIEVRGSVFTYLPLPTWQLQLKALGFIRRIAQRRQT
jgi:hypothetical protein